MNERKRKQNSLPKGKENKTLLSLCETFVSAPRGPGLPQFCGMCRGEFGRLEELLPLPSPLPDSVAFVGAAYVQPACYYGQIFAQRLSTAVKIQSDSTDPGIGTAPPSVGQVPMTDDVPTGSATVSVWKQNCLL